MQDTSKPQHPLPAADRPAPGSLEDLNVTAPYTSGVSGAAGASDAPGTTGRDEKDGTRGQPEQDANNRDRHGLENQSVTKPAPIDVEHRQ